MFFSKYFSTSLYTIICIQVYKLFYYFLINNDDVPSLKYINKVSDNYFELVYDDEVFGVFNTLRACQYARGVMLNFDWNKDIIKYI